MQHAKETATHSIFKEWRTRLENRWTTLKERWSTFKKWWGLGISGRQFALYWATPQLGALAATVLVVGLSTGSFDVPAERFGSGLGVAFKEQWQIWLIVACAHSALSFATIAFTWRLIKDAIREAPARRKCLLLILALTIVVPILLIIFRAHSAIFPPAFEELLKGYELPYSLFGIKAYWAFRVVLWTVFTLTLLMGNFAIFALMLSIVGSNMPQQKAQPAMAADAASLQPEQAADAASLKPEQKETRALRRRYHELRTFTYLTSSIFVLTTLLVYLWANWPTWQMNWVRSAAGMAPPPVWGKLFSPAKSAKEKEPAQPGNSGLTKSSAAPGSKTPDTFDYERGRYAAVASGFVTTFAVVYMTLIMFYFFVPKSEIDRSARDLWDQPTDKGKASDFAEWQKAEGLSTDWVDKVKIALALVGPLLAGPLAEFVGAALGAGK